MIWVTLLSLKMVLLLHFLLFSTMIWVTLVTQPMCLNLTRLLIVFIPKDHHTHQIYPTFYHSVLLCTEVDLDSLEQAGSDWIELQRITFNWITPNVLHCTAFGSTNIGLLGTTPIHSEWVSLTWSCESQYIHQASHTISIRWSSHLRWPDHSQRVNHTE